MLSHITIGDRNLIPLKAAADSVSYTREYVAKLARDGKIAAAQINRQWYIDPASLQAFYDNAQLELRARNDYLRELRKQQLDTMSAYLQKRTQIEKTLATAPTRTLGRLTVVVVMGCLAGVLVYGGVQHATLPVVSQLASVLQASVAGSWSTLFVP